jgi:trans-aconitate 2-methyltransferase
MVALWHAPDPGSSRSGAPPAAEQSGPAAVRVRPLAHPEDAMPEPDWSPDQYDRFRDERSQPFFDLLALVRPRPAMRVVDLGCGTGELTAAMHGRLQAGETLGFDSSEAMLEKSRAHAAPGLSFVKGDIAAPPIEGQFDLLFSNAAIHWVDGHAELLRKLTEHLAEGGQLAVQVPANHDHPSHRVAADVASERPFREALHGYVRRSPVLEPDEYATLLDRLGYREQHVRLQVYAHHLAARDDVIEWVKGTLLTDYQKRLPADLYTLFLERYRELLLPRLSESRPYFYPFKRLLFWARR